MRKNTPKAVIIHHEAGNNGFWAVNAWHKQRWPKFVSSLGFWVGYQYYIDKAGQVFTARQETEEGAHTLGGWNRKSIGICLMGHFDREKPSQSQIRTLRGLLKGIERRWFIRRSRVYGHQEKWRTACPGKNLMKWIRNYRRSNYEFLQRRLDIIRQRLARLLKLIKRLKKRPLIKLSLKLSASKNTTSR